MIDLLNQAVKAAQKLPPDMQDDIARIMLAYAGDNDEIIDLTPKETADLLAAQAEMAEGEFATETEIDAVLVRYRR